MKKQTTKELAVVPAAEIVKGKKTRGRKRAGRKKEKVQMSVRIDKAVMDIAYQHISKTGRRITDMLERGLILAISEEMKMPLEAKELRLLVDNLNIRSRRRVVKMLVLERFDEVRELSVLERCHREFHLLTIDSVENWPGYDRGLALIGQPAEPQIEA